jgi:hypothetical protein
MRCVVRLAEPNPSSRCWCVLAAFVLGSNSSACPSGFPPLDYEKACRHAAEQVVPNKPYGGSLSGDDLKAAYMTGCYWHTIDGRVYFNDKTASAPDRVDSFALQLCAGAPIPARRYAPHTAERGARRSVACRPLLRANLRVHGCAHANTPACLCACVRLCACECDCVHASDLCLSTSIFPYSDRA